MFPNRFCWRMKGVLVLISAGFTSSFALCEELGKESSEALTLVSTRTCYFAEEEVLILLSTGPTADEQTLDWRLTSADRTLRRGRVRHSFTMSLPQLEPGNVVTLELEIAATHAGREKLLAHPIHVFSRDPFAEAHSWLQSARIALFDPVGPTAELCDEQRIPYSRLVNLAAIDRVQEGMILVGEGVSLREHRLLSDALWQAARRGVRVLCLAPSEGEILLPLQQVAKDALPVQMTLGRAEMLQVFDKRFDPLVGVTHLSLVADREQVLLRADPTEGEWTWLDVEFPQGARSFGGRLVFCTWGIVSQWEETPIHRYLLKHLLKEFATHPLSQERYANVTAQD